MMSAHLSVAHQIEAMRRFNRFYTKEIGVLHEGLHKSPFPLTEARVIYELAHHVQTTATQLGNELGLDAGYLSRILSSFEKRGLIAKQPSPTDGRQLLIGLTEQGQAAFAAINARSREEIGERLATLPAAAQQRLIAAMTTIEQILRAAPEQRVPYLLRPHQPGDMGWVVQRHAVLYAQEYGWDGTFEALVAQIVADFINHFDPQRERCWMAEREGAIVGSVFVVQQSAEVAKLRLLLVEPSARGLGIGQRLVDECIRFARQVGYRKLLLWTNSILLPARRIYEKAGFTLIAAEPHHSFGHDLIGETWELPL